MPASQNHEISVYYAVLDEVWNRNEMIVDDAFAYTVALDTMLSDDIELRSIDKCQRRMDWLNWKQAIQVELDSLAKRKMFRHVASTPPHVKPVGYKWVFVRKSNEKNEIVRYKACLVVQSFSRCPGIDYKETYSHVMDGYVNNELCTCVFIKKLHSGFTIVAVYVDDMNLIGTPAEFEEIAMHLKLKFEMKDLGKTRYCHGLEIEHCSDETYYINQTTPRRCYCFWLRAVMEHIRNTSGFSFVVDLPTMIFEDNAACIKQLKKGYINGDKTKHIDNLADLFTKSLPKSTFQKLVQGIVMEHIRNTNSLSFVVDLSTTIFEDNAAFIKQLKNGYIKGDKTKHIDNLADLFTKSLLKSTFQKLVQGIAPQFYMLSSSSFIYGGFNKKTKVLYSMNSIITLHLKVSSNLDLPQKKTFSNPLLKFRSNPQPKKNELSVTKKLTILFILTKNHIFILESQI
ncbi:hypothetical protein D8674_004818 [Pyrus ussuriensis x Pyrus communis]|uniref:Reverse transcriptase Ty1/copia-type domain-containing protein n=1 Tax=Pyrus ussuriensis x Pyrus communis TaxID=2448454 RepID=A0A5N5FTZ1_9ROSA|nr:hypothetical protein D8674_004818 [Pyrus ussuriensis x Pyrus communis]